MKIKWNLHHTWALISGLTVLVFDLTTKWWAASEAFVRVELIPNFFYFTYQVNEGIAFGIPMPTWIQVLASIIILYVLCDIGQEHIFKTPTKSFFPAVLFGIIIGGALGNLISRILSNNVVDFIVLKPFPVFNIADIGITLGLITLFIWFLCNNKS